MSIPFHPRNLFELYLLGWYNYNMAERIEYRQKPLTPEQPKTRETLSDEEMGNLLSGAGNHEAKLITLTLMKNGDIFDRGGLHRRIINSQGENVEWRINRRGPFEYCADSLSPIGLVTKETLNKGGLTAYGYQITKYGKEIGIPLAGLLLKFSEDHKIPLNRFLGGTNSKSQNQITQTKEGKKVESKKRAPSTTLKIFFELVTHPSLPIREVDIIKAIGEDTHPTVFPTILTRLSDLDLIEYDSKGINQPFSLYRLRSPIPEGKLPIYKRAKTLTNLVYNALKENPNAYLTIGGIYKLIPQEQKEKMKENILLNTISRILSDLNGKGYADIQKFHHKKHSEINITDQQKAVLKEFLEIIDGVQNQNPEILKKGERLAEEIIADSQRVSNLLRRAKEASGSANKSPQEETKNDILSIISDIKDNPNGITNKQIQKLLEQSGKRLGIMQIRQLCSLLQKQNSVTVKKQGSVKIFFPNKPPPVSS